MRFTFHIYHHLSIFTFLFTLFIQRAHIAFVDCSTLILEKASVLKYHVLIGVSVFFSVLGKGCELSILERKQIAFAKKRIFE